jgi:hypothetical protein
MRSTAYGLETPRNGNVQTPCSIKGGYHPSMWEFVGVRLTAANREARAICRTECHNRAAYREMAEASGGQYDGQIVAAEPWINGKRADECVNCGKLFVRHNQLSLCADCRRKIDRVIVDG